MIPAEIAALRAQACKVVADLGAALLALEDAESLLQQPRTHALIHEQMESAAGSFESAAARLAELVTSADQAANLLRPVGAPSKP